MVLVVGDSLEVGSAPYIRQALGGVAVEIDAERGRTSSQGLRVLAERLGPEHGVVVFPLGVNDLSADTLAANLAAARELAGGRCVVVATIARPPSRGSSAASLSQVVEAFAAQGGAQVADWRSAALSTPGVLGRDRLHATGQGYALRGSLLAEAVQGCLLGELNGIPAPEDPDARPPPREPARPRSRPEPRPRPAPAPPPPVEVPVRAVVLGLVSALDRVLSPVVAAFRDARTAATKAEPEPVLGAR